LLRGTLQTEDGKEYANRCCVKFLGIQRKQGLHGEARFGALALFGGDAEAIFACASDWSGRPPARGTGRVKRFPKQTARPPGSLFPLPCWDRSNFCWHGPCSLQPSTMTGAGDDA
jgi:hypothetical protein